MIEPDCEFECPYCGEINNVRLDVTGGSRQAFIQDCAVCCQPINITAQFENEELIELSVERQD